MTTAWSHLPNAVHIDRVLLSFKAKPGAWNASWNESYSAAKNAAEYSVEFITRNAVWNTAWDAVWNTAKNMSSDYTKYITSNVIMALVAWDDCAHLLDSEPEHVKLLAALGVPAAVLLYPACVVLSKEREFV